MNKMPSRALFGVLALIVVAVICLAASLPVAADPEEPGGGGGCYPGEWVINWWSTCSDGTFCRAETYNTCTGETKCDGPIFYLCPK